MAGFLSTASLGLYVRSIGFHELLARLVAQSVGMVAYPAVASKTDLASGRRVVWLRAMASRSLGCVDRGGARSRDALVAAVAVLVIPCAPAVVPAQILVIRFPDFSGCVGFWVTRSEGWAYLDRRP